MIIFRLEGLIMRTFIGADFSRDIKESIAGVQHVVRENSERGRFKYVGTST